MLSDKAFLNIDGFGPEMNKSLLEWWNNHKYEFCELAKEFTFEKHDDVESQTDLSNKIFVITGSLNCYANRNELVNVIDAPPS